ncbi:unnamed protein product, partial [Medioppia subpectinata]
DNGLEVLPPIGDDGTQAADNQLKAKQEIIDILDDSDSEDTAATPVTHSLPTKAVTPMVPTANVHHYGTAAVTANQTVDIWLQNSLITQPLNKPTRVNENSTKTCDETTQVIINAKTPPMGQLCSTGSAQLIQPAIIAGQTRDQLVAISETDSMDNTIESYVIFIGENSESIEPMFADTSVDNTTTLTDTTDDTDTTEDTEIIMHSNTTLNGDTDSDRTTEEWPQDITNVTQEDNSDANHCRIYRQTFATRNDFQTHTSLVHNKLQANCVCGDCGQAFHSYSLLTTHRYIGHTIAKTSQNITTTDPSAAKATAYRCHKCDKSFASKRGLQTHDGIVHALKPKITSDDNWMAGDHNYSRIIVNGGGDRPALDTQLTSDSNDVSDSQDRTKLSINRQTIDGSAAIDWAVGASGNQYRNEHFVDKPVTAAHPASQKPYPCSRAHCFKIFQSDQSLQQHIQTAHHSSEPPLDLPLHMCPHEGCAKKYDFVDCLTLHIRKVHSQSVVVAPAVDRKPYPCRHRGCGRAFSSQLCLNGHIKSAHFTKGSTL